MPSPEQFGLRTIETKGTFHETERERSFGHAAEDLFIEALRNHEAIDRVEHASAEEDEVGKTDILVYFKGESEPIKVQLFAGKNEEILDKKETTLPKGVTLVHDRGTLSRALRRSGDDWSVEGIRNAAASLGQHEISELFGQILDGMPRDKKAALLMRLQGRLTTQTSKN
jgi:hypothetical protein